MIQMVNMVLGLEKELESERQGLRRTRRYIGDVRRVIDPRWYQPKICQVAENMHNLSEGNQVAEAKPCREARHSILKRFLHLPHTPHQPARCECE